MSGPPAFEDRGPNPPQPGVHGPALHPHESAKGPAGNPGRATRILLVEDDPALAEIATLMLETLGYDVPAVLGEGEAACDVARREGVDLALLDVRLPGAIDGIEAGERIRAALDIPVVYATALQDEGTLRRAVASRPYGYIVKPYQSIDLRSAIELALERHRAEHDVAEREAEFRRVLESTRDVTTVLDPDGTIRYESPAVYRVMGYEPDALIGRSVFEFLDPDDIPPVRALLGRLVFRPDSSRTEQIRFRHQDGSWRVLEATGSAFRDSRGDLRVVVSSRDVSERVRLADELERMAFGDPLTKAANRRALERQGEKILALAERHRHRAALVYVDLARFKGVNDTLGHAAGDAYLVEVADRFREVARDSDVVARVGGDEFAVLFSEVRDEEGAASAARRLMKALEAPARVGEREIPLRAHFGVALFPEHGRTIRALLDAADRAMYACKRRAGGASALELPHRRRADERRLEAELRGAPDRDELRLHFQPILRARGHAVEGIEAFARWQHPRLGLLKAAEFLPAVGRADLVRDLDWWVLRAALREMARRARSGPLPWVSVNVSPSSFCDPDLGSQISASLHDADLGAERLVIEISERAPPPDLHAARANLRALHALGVRVALDDFGTGDAGLDYLRHLPVDYLKLEAMFVSDVDRSPETGALARAVIELGQTMGMQIVAEGIERQAQDEWARESGCDLVQGFLHGRPETIEKLIG